MGFWKSIGKAIFNALPVVMLYNALAPDSQPAQPAQAPAANEPPAPEIPMTASQKADRRRTQYSPNAPAERRTLLSPNDQQMLGDNKTLLGG
jgi:hypothetical protein